MGIFPLYFEAMLQVSHEFVWHLTWVKLSFLLLLRVGWWALSFQVLDTSRKKTLKTRTHEFSRHGAANLIK